jgi:protein O-mannosyl-transferase
VIVGRFHYTVFPVDVRLPGLQVCGRMEHPPAQAPTMAFPRLFWLGALLVVLGALAAYHNSFDGPFVFDDRPSILENETIRRLSLPEIFRPPAGTGLTVEGRPLLNASLAINYALSGENVRSYHVANFAIHLGAGLLLYGFARRTLLKPALQRGRLARADTATALATAIAVLWTVHPLQTESVTYIVQRAESLVGFFCFLTFYCFVRATDETSRRHAQLWRAGSVAACFLGMASKEVMVAVPLLVWVYDRTFVAGSFMEAWRRSRGYYAGLAASWAFLVWLLTSSAARGGTAGFGGEISSWHYLLTQCQAIMHYLRLVVWPQPLVLDYGTDVVTQPGRVWLQALLLIAAAVGTTIALVRGRPVGFVGLWFFALLAPSSSIVPVVTQTMAEHRMYLPLAACMGVGVVFFYSWLGRVGLGICAVLALVFCGMTYERNRDYRTELGLWNDVLKKRPENPRAYNSIGMALVREKRAAEALPYIERALQLTPTDGPVHNNMANVLSELERHTDAIRHYELALKYLRPKPEIHYNLAGAQMAVGRADDAVKSLKDALALDPAFAEAYNRLGNVFLELKRVPEAIEAFSHEVRLRSDVPEARVNLAGLYAEAGRFPEAIEQLEAAIKLRPGDAEMYQHLGHIFGAAERLPESAAAFAKVVELVPQSSEAHNNLGIAHARLGRFPEAGRHFERALQLDAKNEGARQNLSRLRAMQPGPLRP